MERTTFPAKNIETIPVEIVPKDFLSAFPHSVLCLDDKIALWCGLITANMDA